MSERVRGERPEGMMSQLVASLNRKIYPEWKASQNCERNRALGLSAIERYFVISFPINRSFLSVSLLFHYPLLISIEF